MIISEGNPIQAIGTENPTAIIFPIEQANKITEQIAKQLEIYKNIFILLEQNLKSKCELFVSGRCFFIFEIIRINKEEISPQVINILEVIIIGKKFPLIPTTEI
jgi:hypothetical protein